MMWLCRYCSMPVRTTTVHCPRCRHSWPALTRQHARAAAFPVLASLAVAGGVALAWVVAAWR
jgi:hypothetical protein